MSGYGQGIYGQGTYGQSVPFSVPVPVATEVPGPILDVTGALDFFMTGTYLVKRTTRIEASDDGIYPDPFVTYFNVPACYQPMDGGDTEARLPEGNYSYATVKLLTRVQLLVQTDTYEADEVFVDGAWHKVLSSKNWKRIGGYYRVIAL